MEAVCGNCVTAIRNLVPPEIWRDCPGKENPTDIPSRGMSASALFESVWLSGPDWLKCRAEAEVLSDVSEYRVPDECQVEMKRKDLTRSLTVGTT